MLSIKRTLAFLAALMLTFSTAGAPLCAFAATESDARSAIVAAEERIVVSYQAVAEAEKAGANTTTLLTTLNEAGKLLSKANLAYGMDDFDSALDFAFKSQEKLNGFVEEADALRENAIQQHYLDFLVYVVGPIVGTIVVICGGFVVWYLLKKKCEKAGSVVE